MADAPTSTATEPRSPNGAIAASVALAARAADHPPAYAGPPSNGASVRDEDSPSNGTAPHAGPSPNDAAVRDASPVSNGESPPTGSPNGASTGNGRPASNGAPAHAGPPNGAFTGNGSSASNGASPYAGSPNGASPGNGSPAPNGAAVPANGFVRHAIGARALGGAAPAWTALPGGDGGLARAERAWQERREALERELAGAAQALARVRDDERAAREAIRVARADVRAVRAARAADASALAVLRAELDAERIAHAVSRATAARLAADLAAARAELAKSRATPRRPGIHLRAHEQAHAAAQRPLPGNGRLVADLEAAAAALRRAASPPEEAAPAPVAAVTGPGEAAPPPQAMVIGSDEAVPPPAAAAGPDEAAPSPPLAAVGPDEVVLPPATGVPSDEDTVPPPDEANASASAAPSDGDPGTVGSGSVGVKRRLRKALVALAQHDPLAAGRLLIALLPAQAAVLDEPASYDLTVRGLGTFAVSVKDGAADVRRLAKPRRRGEATFHLKVETLALAELLAGERTRIRRFRGPARASGKRRRTAELAPLVATKLSLADVVRAGARLDPEAVYAVLPYAIEPEWTRGRSFTVEQEIVDPSPRSWYLTARDGEPLAVSEHPPAERPDATVTMSRATFAALLRGEPPAAGERPAVRGDLAAVAALKSWTDRAAGR